MGCLGPRVFDASTRLVQLAAGKGLTVGTAESCTGGLVCAAITDVPGSSNVCKGGVVSYAVPVKEAILGVPASVTRTPTVGVVSAECAEAMASGARKLLGCDIAVSTTGIAGPGGAEESKPVGTVWFGIATTGGIASERHVFSGNRDEVREQAALKAVELLVNATMCQ